MATNITKKTCGQVSKLARGATINVSRSADRVNILCCEPLAEGLASFGLTRAILSHSISKGLAVRSARNACGIPCLLWHGYFTEHADGIGSTKEKTARFVEISAAFGWRYWVLEKS